MPRILYAVALGLFGAGIVHIAIVLLVPSLASQDAWSKLAARSEPYAITRLDGTEGADIIRMSADPQVYVNACRFDLEEGYARITAPGRVPYWSVSIYDRRGRNIYSFNDRASTNGTLDFAVVTPGQMVDIRKGFPEELASAVLVEADIDEGVALVRVLVPDETWAPRLTAYMSGMICRQE